MDIFDFKEIGLAPNRATKYSAGYDLKTRKDVHLFPGQQAIVQTGVYINPNSKEWLNLREGHYFGLHIRSSMAKKGLRLMNGVGVIDMDYDKEIGIMIENVSDSAIILNKYDRVAQLVLNKCIMLGSSSRNREDGFGSTGE